MQKSICKNHFADALFRSCSHSNYARSPKERYTQAADSTGDIRSAGKSPARFGNGSGARSRTSRQSKNPNPFTQVKPNCAPRFQTGQSRGFPEATQSPAFCLLFLEKVGPVPRGHEYHAPRIRAKLRKKRAAAFQQQLFFTIRRDRRSLHCHPHQCPLPQAPSADPAWR